MFEMQPLNIVWWIKLQVLFRETRRMCLLFFCHGGLLAENWFQASLTTTCGSSPSLRSPWSFVVVQEKLRKHITELHFDLFWRVSSSAAAAKYLAEHEKLINPLLRIVPQQMHCVLLSG